MSNENKTENPFDPQDDETIKKVDKSYFKTL